MNNSNLKCIKRDGTVTPFTSVKIFDAIKKANIQASNVYSDEDIEEAVNRINAAILSLGVDEISVENIQDIVVKDLMLNLTDIAEGYITYRYKREMARNKNIVIIDKYKARVECENVQNSNANVDEYSFSGREKEAASDVSKTIALEFGGLSPKIAKAHKEMLVYQHDLEKAIYGVHNCLFLNFDKLFDPENGGFETRNGGVRVPTVFSTAAQQMPVAFQLNSLCQFGGVATIHADTDLAKFVKNSYQRYYRIGLKFIESRSRHFIDTNYPKDEPLSIGDPKYDLHPLVKEYADEMMENELRQGCEALYHNLNTLESRSGSQLPFTSLNLGRDITPEGRMVSKGLLDASIAGIGKFHKTSIFPISIFQYKKGVNANPGDPNYDIMQKALESLSKRIYPNFINCDFSEAHEDPNDPDTLFAGMGKQHTAHVKLR